jgi:hypothetical protein
MLQQCFFRFLFWKTILGLSKGAKVNQQPPMQQLAILSTKWAAIFHSTLDGVHHNPFFLLLTIVFFFGGVLGYFFLGPDLTQNYPLHFPTLISIAPTLKLFLLSPTDIATLITNYPIDLATILTTYLTKLATLLITYPINLIIILTTYPTNLATLHTQPPYWHKYFTNLVTLIR